MRILDTVKQICEHAENKHGTLPEHRTNVKQRLNLLSTKVISCTIKIHPDSHFFY